MNKNKIILLICCLISCLMIACCVSCDLDVSNMIDNSETETAEATTVKRGRDAIDYELDECFIFYTKYSTFTMSEVDSVRDDLNIDYVVYIEFLPEAESTNFPGYYIVVVWYRPLTTASN